MTEEEQEETELLVAALVADDVLQAVAAFGTPDCCCCCWCWAWPNLAEHGEGAALKRVPPPAAIAEGLAPLEEAEEEAAGWDAGAVSKSMLVA